MGQRFVFTAFTLAFSVAIIFATLTTVRQVGIHSSAAQSSGKRS